MYILLHKLCIKRWFYCNLGNFYPHMLCMKNWLIYIHRNRRSIAYWTVPSSVGNLGSRVGNHHYKDCESILQGKSRRNRIYSNRSNLACKNNKIQVNLCSFLCFVIAIESHILRRLKHNQECNSNRLFSFGKLCS